MGASRDTSAPMELGVVEAGDDDAWEVASPLAEMLTGEGESPSEPASDLFEDERVVSDEPVAEDEQQANFITRERRSSDRSWRPERSGDYNRRGRSSTGESVKQQFARRNNCWNCGKVGHFLVDCPYQKGSSTSAMVGAGPPSSVTVSKPSSKKF